MQTNVVLALRYSQDQAEQLNPSRKLSLYMIFNDFVRGQAKGARIGDGVMAVCVSHVNVKAKSSECGSWMACCKVLAPELPNKFSVPER